MSSNLTVVFLSLLLAIPAVISWLWLVILPARLAILCPEGCRCDLLGYQVKCTGPSLNAVPPIRLTNVQELSLYRNDITLFERDKFVTLTELEGLIVSWCGLRRVELGAFNGLTKLRSLSIEDNDIRELLTGTFENLSSLEYLGLMDNKLEYLQSDVFRGLVKLERVTLSGNKLQYIHPDVFLKLPNLQQLELYRNFDLQIPTDSNFINSHSLSHLDMSNCNVSSLSVETFAKLSALESVDLSYNNLRTVDINILRALRNLSTIYLSGNPLQCDCQLQEVWRWCKDRNIQTEYGGTAPECDTPREVKGMWWGVLEKGKCLEGNIQYYGDYNSTRYNHTDTENDFYHKYDVDSFEQNEFLLYTLPIIFASISNYILLHMIICKEDMRTVPNMYILNLAISDIINLMVIFFEACENRSSGRFLAGDMCIFLPFCHRLSVGVSAYSVAMYSFRRYRVTVNFSQVNVSSQATWRFDVAAICGVWIVAGLFAVPSALSKYLCEELFLSGSKTYYENVVIFELLVSCLLPVCVVAFSYVMTGRHLVKLSRSISEGAENPQLETIRNTAEIVVGLAFVLMISHVPYHVYWTYFVYSEKTPYLFKFNHTYLISTILILVNSCLNPVALFCTSPKNRKHCKSYITCLLQSIPLPHL